MLSDWIWRSPLGPDEMGRSLCATSLIWIVRTAVRVVVAVPAESRYAKPDVDESGPRIGWMEPTGASS